MNYTINIRPKRQVTIPQEILDNLGLDIGDSFQINVNKAEKQATITPSKTLALDAFQALQEAFQKSTTPETELQEEVDQHRQKNA